MKKLIFILLLFTACSKKDADNPAPSASGTSNWDGTYNLSSVICSNPSYTEGALRTITVKLNGSQISFPANQLNFGIDLPVGAAVTGTSATMSSFYIDEHHRFMGGHMTLSGNKINMTYELDLYYDGGQVLLSANSYTIVYEK